MNREQERKYVDIGNCGRIRGRGHSLGCQTPRGALYRPWHSHCGFFKSNH